MPSVEIKENAIYRVEELSQIFDIPEASIRTLIKNGHIQGIKMNKRWLVRGKSLLKLFDVEEKASANSSTHLNKLKEEPQELKGKDEESHK